MYFRRVSALLVFVCGFWVAFVYWPTAQAQVGTVLSVSRTQPAPGQLALMAWPQTDLTLQISTDLTATAGSVITVPLSYVGAGNAVSALAFSLDLDQHCLTFDPQDQNRDGQPDALTFHSPSGFTIIVATDLADEDGELDIIVADLVPPFVALPDRSPLLTIRLRAACQPEAGATQRALIRFSADPTPSFASTTGDSLQGTAVDGWVTIVGPSVPATLTPTVTPSPTLAATAPTATPTPTLLPTAPATVIPTTIVESFTATPAGAAIQVQWRTTREVDTAGFYLYRKQLDGQGSSGDFQQISPRVPGQGIQGGNYTLLDPSVQANVRYLYLLVEEKRNGARTEFTQLLIAIRLSDTQPYQLLLPLVVR